MSEDTSEKAEAQGDKPQGDKAQETEDQGVKAQGVESQGDKPQEAKSKKSSKSSKSKESGLSEQEGSSSDLKEAMATLRQRGISGGDASASEASSDESVENKEETTEEQVEGGSAASGVAVAARGVEVVVPVYEAKHDALGRSYATGKRKTSVVRVWMKRGRGEVKVNGKTLEKYFSREVLSMIVRQPLEVAKCEGMFDVMATAKGGGLSGQAGALRHGLARALYLFDPGYRPVLKRAGFLTRDARIVERKKYGKPKARRSFQFSKR